MDPSFSAEKSGAHPNVNTLNGPPGQMIPGSPFDTQPGLVQGAPPPYTYVDQPISQAGIHTSAVIITDPNFAHLNTVQFVLGPEPSQGLCPCCGQFIITRIQHEMGSHAYTWMVIFCILGGLLCVWIPAVVDSMQDVMHFCPNCHNLLGRFNR